MKILKVFVNEDGLYGNPVGMVVDLGKKISAEGRQQIATKSEFSEVVFVNDIDERNISIYTPQNEIKFAGHAVVGAAYFLNKEYKVSVTELVSMGGKIYTWQEDNLTWVRCNTSLLPHWNYKQLNAPAEVELLTPAAMSRKEHVVVWSWIDEGKGIVRARTFATDWDIVEDEASGSGSMKLAVNLGRELTVRHGKGSVICARPSQEHDMAEVGGSVGSNS